MHVPSMCRLDHAFGQNFPVHTEIFAAQPGGQVQWLGKLALGYQADAYVFVAPPDFSQKPGIGRGDGGRLVQIPALDDLGQAIAQDVQPVPCILFHFQLKVLNVIKLIEQILQRGNTGFPGP